jgi:hypothetical protein
MGYNIFSRMPQQKFVAQYTQSHKSMHFITDAEEHENSQNQNKKFDHERIDFT